MDTYSLRNTTTKMVILRCIGPDSFFREKVMLPLELFVWDCPAESRVDLWSYGLSGTELLDSLDVAELAAVGCSIHQP
ncbi:MAG: DUF1830 domain-containing protein [Cyanobacteria bacterium M_surface_10_m1_298]|nr:DUF1830 domain-containing protein [Cyanobacteria bacterium M_surface_10_m1_298]